jgi:endoglucanase
VGARHEAWPAWQRFKLLYLSAEGRVIDASSDSQITTSTSQAYALFFALIANDRAAFDDILDWTQHHLAGGEFTRSLPAAQWGRDAKGTWRVLDAQASSHANLWIAYTLGEAARLWGDGSYLDLAAEIVTTIVAQEVASVPVLGPTLLSGTQGAPNENRWHFNPGDLALPAIRGIARQTKDPIWAEIAQSAERIILGSAPNGFAVDWTEFTPMEGFTADRASQRPGGLDAIRVYLWTGMLPASDPARDTLAIALKPMLNSIAKPEAPTAAIDTQSLEMHVATPGASAALLPMLANARMSATLQVHRRRAAEECLQGNQQCQSDMLTLFGLGWLEQRYRFNRAGLLSVRWTPVGNRPH